MGRAATDLIMFHEHFCQILDANDSVEKQR